MNIRKFLLYIAAIPAAAVVSGCSSVGETLSAADISLDELQSRKDIASDPEGRFARSQSYVMRQEISDEGIFGVPDKKIVELKYKRPNKIKSTIYSEGEPLNGYIINGDSAWTIDYKSRKVYPIPLQHMEQLKTLTRLNTPSSKIKDVFKNVRLEYCSTGEGNYYKLTCSNNENNIFEIYIDAKSYLTGRVRTTLLLPQGTVKSDSVMKSYSLYEGVRIADEATSRSGDTSQIQKVVDYKLDVPLEDEEFKPPVL